MLPLIEEMDKGLSDIPPEKRIDTVGQIIMSSLNTSNPFKAMRDAINFHNSIKGMKKASYFVAGSRKMSLGQAHELLRLTILNSPYFVNKLDYSKSNSN
jgi:hypothetical protein